MVKLNYLNADGSQERAEQDDDAARYRRAEPGTNSVIITDVPTRIDAASSKMISDMDKKLRQVEIVAKMVDVDHEATRELGVNWAALNLNLGNKAIGDVVTGQRAGRTVRDRPGRDRAVVGRPQP